VDKLFAEIKTRVDTTKYITLINRAITKPAASADIGKQIAYYRKAKGLTQKQFAELVQVSKSLVFKYEKGIIHNKDKKILGKMCGILEIEDEGENKS